MTPCILVYGAISLHGVISQMTGIFVIQLICMWEDLASYNKFHVFSPRNFPFCWTNK